MHYAWSAALDRVDSALSGLMSFRMSCWALKLSNLNIQLLIKIMTKIVKVGRLSNGQTVGRAIG